MEHIYNAQGYNVKPLDTFPCVNCKEMATATKHNKKAKYCSRQCSGSAQKKPPEIKLCLNCQTPFEVCHKHKAKKHTVLTMCP